MNPQMPDSGSMVSARIIARRSAFDIDLNLGLAKGETVAVIGPNGSGKSTLIRCLTGLLPISDGEIALGDTIVDSPASGVFVEPAHRGIGVVFQDSLVFPHLNVVDNVAYGLRSRGHGRRESRRLALECLGDFGLSHLAQRRGSDLSGGQARRVAVARALAPNPTLVLFDEPFAGLDASSSAELAAMLARGGVSRAAQLVVTHQYADAETFADRVVVIEGGRITQDGPPISLRHRPATRYVADVVGSNTIFGEAADGVVVLANGHRIYTVNAGISGSVAVSIASNAVSIHLNEPSGSARNRWIAPIDEIHSQGDIARVGFVLPIPILVDLHPSTVVEMDLKAGREVWVSVKASAVHLDPR